MTSPCCFLSYAVSLSIFLGLKICSWQLPLCFFTRRLFKKKKQKKLFCFCFFNQGGNISTVWGLLIWSLGVAWGESWHLHPALVSTPLMFEGGLRVRL